MNILFITIVIGIILVLTFSRIVTVEIVEPNKKKDAISLNNNNNSNLSNNLQKNNNNLQKNNNNLQKNNNNLQKNNNNLRNNNSNENNKINTKNINKYDNSINHNKERYMVENKIGKVNPKSFSQALYQLPEPDSIMSQEMRNQITSLKNKYYYDNCKYVDY